MLVGFVGLLGNQLDPLLGAGVDVPGLVAVRDGYLLQFIEAIADRRDLPTSRMLCSQTGA